MKKLLVAAVAAMAYSTAFAGYYHAGAQNICADCHTMHASMAHDYAGATPTSAAPKAFGDGSWLPNQGAPEDFLLKGTETGVCVACHDGQNWAPDVVDVNANTYVRSGGFIPPVAGNGHTMDFTGNVPGGAGSEFGATVAGFTCVSCHSPHGKADAYRNLNPYSLYGQKGDTNYPKFYLGATSTQAADVRINASYNQADPTGAATFATRIPYYSNENVYFEKAVNNLDRYCGKCHGQFHNGAPSLYTGTNSNQVSLNTTPTGGAIFVRHPTNRVITSPAGGTTAPSFTTKVYSVSATENYVGCLSCHKAHGTANPFGLFYAATATRTGPNVFDNTESGAQAGKATGFAGSCSNCHGMARP